MTTTTQKTAPKKSPVTKAKELANVTVKLPKEARERPENFIVPAGLMGKQERWFIKKNLVSFKSATKTTPATLVMSQRQAKERGLI
jgi:hypothetical protein